jgi:hypothetical protein
VIRGLRAGHRRNLRNRRGATSNFGLFRVPGAVLRPHRVTPVTETWSYFRRKPHAVYRVQTAGRTADIPRHDALQGVLRIMTVPQLDSQYISKEVVNG